MMKRYAIVLLALASLPALTAAATIDVSTDHPDATYKVGEPIVFRVAIKDGPVGPEEVLESEIFDDRLQRMTSDEWRGGPTIETKLALDRPGFLRLEVRLMRKGTTKPTTTASIGVAVEPEKLMPSLPVPDDFDAFWAGQLKQLAAAPQPPPVLTPVDSKSPAIEAFDVQIADSLPGTHLSAYYARPKGAKPKSLPAIVYAHSAGVRDSDLPHAVRGAKLAGGAIVIDFNAHGLKNAQPAQFYTDQLKGPLADYAVRGLTDREKNYFRQMYLRGQRARDFLTSQPEWDGRILIAEGSSQGGAQSLVAAGLDPRVTLCLAAVPALSDLTGPTAYRESGWPRMLRPNRESTFDEKAVQALRYVDVMNFASRIKCRTIVSVGLVDRTCAPSTVYAAFNNIPATTDKTIVVRPRMGHAFPRDLIAAWDDEIRKHVAVAAATTRAAVSVPP